MNMLYLKKSSHDLFKIARIALSQLHLFVCKCFETTYNGIVTANKSANFKESSTQKHFTRIKSYIRLTQFLCSLVHLVNPLNFFHT